MRRIREIFLNLAGYMYKDDIDLFFRLIDKSLEGTTSSKEQHFKFLKLASEYDFDQIDLLYFIAQTTASYIISEFGESMLLYINEDSLYLSSKNDLLNFIFWIIFRGENFINKYLMYGNEFILNYIINNEVLYKDYKYDSFIKYLDSDLFNGNYLKNFTDCI